MKPEEIIKHINDGANFYLKFLGDAEHMEYHNKGTYSYIQPKTDMQGVRFAFNVCLEDMPKNEQVSLIREIKSLNMPVWWDLQSSADLFELIHNKEKEVTFKEPKDGDELYMAMFPNELMQITMAQDILIKKVDNSSDFIIWANLQNEILCNGYMDIHPQNHYKWCEKGLIDCYICYVDNKAVAFSSVMYNRGICSLEFVGTHPDFRKLGFAKAICYVASKNAFDHGAEIITVRAVNPGTRELYTGLGFKTYNFAL